MSLAFILKICYTYNNMTTKSAFIIVRVSPDFKKKVSKKAGKKGVSEWAREALELHAQKV